MSKNKIAIIGLGYVGLPLARLFATKYSVVGFDVNQERVIELQSGTDSTLEVEDEVLVHRLLERGKTSGRPDDADEGIIRNRIKEYYNKTAILKDYYSSQDKYFGVDGVGSIEEITERLSTVLDKL